MGILICFQSCKRMTDFHIRIGLTKHYSLGQVTCFEPHYFVLYLVASSSLVPHGLQPTRLICPCDSPVQNTGVGCHALLQENFPTQGLNTHLPHCRRILYCLSHQGSSRILEWEAYPSPVDLPDPGIESWSPPFQANSLPAELPIIHRDVTMIFKYSYSYSGYNKNKVNKELS